MEVAGEANHIQHNFLVDERRHGPAATSWSPRAWKGDAVEAGEGRDVDARTLIGEGSPGEVKLGRVGGRRLLATVEPWHGAGVAVYAEKPGRRCGRKTTIETALTEGHALGWADFDGDGNDELAVGWRRGKPGVAVYFVDRDGALQVEDDGGRRRHGHART